MVRIRASVLALVATLALTVGVAPALAKGKHARQAGKGDARARRTPSARRSPTRTSTSSWPTGSRTATRPTTRAGCRPARTRASPASTRPTRAGTTAATSPGLLGRDRLHRRARDHRDLAHAELQEQGGPGQRRVPVRRVPRLLDHRLHADRPAPRDQPGPAQPRGRRPRARHQGLLRHHHQPHGRRHRVPGRRRAAVHLEGPLSLPRRRRHGVRRSRLRGRQHVPGARAVRAAGLPRHARPAELPVQPVRPGRRAGRRRSRTG